MLTYNFTGAANLGSETAPTGAVTTVGQDIPYGRLRMGIMKSRVDVSKCPTLSSTDVYEAILIPKGTKVIDAWFYVVTAESGTNAASATLALGITGGTTDGFVTAAVCNAVGLHATNASTYTNAGGLTVNTADTIDLLVATNAFTNVVVDVYALVVDLNP